MLPNYHGSNSSTMVNPSYHRKPLNAELGRDADNGSHGCHGDNRDNMETMGGGSKCRSQINYN